MDSQLLSISKIFTERLYRIPDYQRGYAWTEKQLKDYWGDIVQLEEGKNHYVGVLTLEKVPNEIFAAWEDDKWIIESKSFQPYYVVDGQQRLTTTIILIQAITEVVPENSVLNYTLMEDIRRRYIFDSKDGGVSRSYIFGYEKDNPSYEFLKSNIYNEHSSTNMDEETIYTNNLENAKSFFIDKIQALKIHEIESLFKKVTQNLLFNIYSISSEIDVFVTFETMNNRGKPLSNLELLKNRLIYLSTKFDVPDSEQKKLRRQVNDAWKAIYHNLGRNKSKPLDDDQFLLNHFLVYFGKQVGSKDDDLLRRNNNWIRENYVDYLLEQRFNTKNIYIHSGATHVLKLTEVYDYAESLAKSVKIWYDLFNPPAARRFNDEEKYWLEKLSRAGIKQFLPLILQFYLLKPSKSDSLEMLRSLERIAFYGMLFNRYFRVPPFEFEQMAMSLSTEKDVKRIVKSLTTMWDRFNYRSRVFEVLNEVFSRTGYYDWEGIRYFLFEYDLYLRESSKTTRKKIDWKEFNAPYEDYITVEHIYPQKATAACWSNNFNHLKPMERKSLQNSLGNLLPLSKPKNSSLQNNCFETKIDNNKNKVGYRYGSFSENEVSKLSNWTPERILERGINLLEFMERRWGVELGDTAKKTHLLNLGFMLKKRRK